MAFLSAPLGHFQLIKLVALTALARTYGVLFPTGNRVVLPCALKPVRFQAWLAPFLPPLPQGKIPLNDKARRACTSETILRLTFLSHQPWYWSTRLRFSLARTTYATNTPECSLLQASISSEPFYMNPCHTQAGC